MSTLEAVHILLDIRLLNDPKLRGALVGTMLKVAPTSPLYLNSVTVQGQVSLVGATYNALLAAEATAAASRHQAEIDAAAALAARGANNGAIVLLKATALHDGKTVADVKSLGYDGYLGKPPAAAMDVPGQIDQKPGPKGSARVTATVYETPGATRGRYVAQTTPGIATAASIWTAAPGLGKQRKLEGASGTSLSLQFARVRGQTQSAWSQAVVVTFP